MKVGQVEFSIRVDGLDEVLSKLQQVESIANHLDGSRFRSTMGKVGNTARETTRGLGVAANQMKDYQSLVDSQTRKIAQWGSRMQTLGNGLQRVTSPFLSVFRGFAMGIGYKALGKVTQSIQGAFSRYDTMRTYANVLEELGINASKKFSVGMGEAKTAVDNLEQSVLGLPTGLDEMVGAMRRYAGSTGEIEKATKLAIAANNTYIAGQMDERAKLFTERQLKSLAGGAELATTQWESLQRNAPMAMRAVAKELDISVQDMMTSLKNGKISGQEFLDTFIKVGTEGRIQQAAQKMKMTWDAVSQNISNAFNRMGSNILSTLDDVFKKTTGRDFLQTVLGVDSKGNAVGGGIKDFIDGISESIQKFIRTNPDKIMNFFDTLRSIDWKGILTGYGDVAKFYAKMFGGLTKVFGGRAFAPIMTGLNFAGKLFTTIGSFARGLARPLAILSIALSKGGGIGKMGTFFSTLSGIAPDMQAAADSLSGIRWTKNRLQAFNMMNDTAIAMGKLRLANKALNIGAILAIAGAFKLVASAMKDISGLDIEWGRFGKNMAQMGIAMTGISGFAIALGAINFIPIIGQVTAAAKFLGALETTGMAIALKTVANALNDVAKAEIPDSYKIGQVLQAMSDIAMEFESVNPLEAIGKVFDSWSKGSQADAVKKVTGALDSIKKLANTTFKKGEFKKAKKNFLKINEVMDDLASIFEVSEKTADGKTYGYRQKATSGQKSNVRSYATLDKQVQNYASMVQGLSGAFENMSTLIVNMRRLQNKFAKITGDKTKYPPLDFTAVRDTVTQIAKAIWEFGKVDSETQFSPFQMLQKASKQLEGTNLDTISTTMDKVPRLVESLWSVYRQLQGSPLFSGEGVPELSTKEAMGFGDKTKITKSPLQTLKDNLDQVFTTIGEINTMITESGNPQELSANTGFIKEAIGTLKQIITDLQSLSTSGAAEAGNVDITGLDTIGEKISTFITKIGTALNSFSGFGGVSGVALNAGSLLAAVNGIKTAVSTLKGISISTVVIYRIAIIVVAIDKTIDCADYFTCESFAVTVGRYILVIPTVKFFVFLLGQSAPVVCILSHSYSISSMLSVMS